MSLGITIKGHNIVGNIRQTIATINFDSSYPTGGEPLSARNLALGVVDNLQVFPKNGYIFEYDYTNSKLKAYHPRAAITNTLAVSTPVLAHASGATAVTSSAATVPNHTAAACTITGVAGIAAGVGTEVPNTTDLSALTNVRIVAMGV